MTIEQHEYAARLEIDYPEKLDRLTTFFRLLWVIPIMIIWGAVNAYSTNTVVLIDDAGEYVESLSSTSAGIAGSLAFALVLMIIFRQKYPRWWFDFLLELNRFGMRVGAYLVLLTDLYPSTDERQAVQLDLDYPDAESDLNRFLPLVKWFLLIPHYFVLAFLVIGALFVVVIAWFAILFTGRYPRGLFDYMVGVGRWGMRVNAYGFLLITDQYPPFSLR